MAYSIILTLHSFVRWVLVIVAVVAVVRAFAGWLGKKEWTALDSRWGPLVFQRRFADAVGIDPLYLS